MISKSRRFSRYNSVAATDRMTMQYIVHILILIARLEHQSHQTLRRSSLACRHRRSLCLVSDPPTQTITQMNDDAINQSKHLLAGDGVVHQMIQ